MKSLRGCFESELLVKVVWVDRYVGALWSLLLTRVVADTVENWLSPLKLSFLSRRRRLLEGEDGRDVEFPIAIDVECRVGRE